MKIALTLITGAFLAMSVAGCGAPPPAPVAPADAPEDNEPVVGDDMRMSGINLYMHRRQPQEGVADKPDLWVRADTFSMEGVDAYRFENASAVLYGRAEGEEVSIDALYGHFEQGKSAVLEGDVRLEAGTLTMHLADIQWRQPEEEDESVAWSDKPVTINDPDLQLNAASLRLYPDTQTFELLDVSGMVRFEKELL